MLSTIIGFMRKIKGAIMKACRFIMNTDYITPQNDTEIELSVTLPSSYTVPATQTRKFSASQTIKGAGSRDFRCYFTSTAFNYALTGCLEATLQFGSDTLWITVERAKDKFTLSVYGPAYPSSSHTFSGTGQTITAHIQTFKDAFDVEL